jgi:hypothetical protein
VLYWGGARIKCNFSKIGRNHFKIYPIWYWNEFYDFIFSPNSHIPIQLNWFKKRSRRPPLIYKIIYLVKFFFLFFYDITFYVRGGESIGSRRSKNIFFELTTSDDSGLLYIGCTYMILKLMRLNFWNLPRASKIAWNWYSSKKKQCKCELIIVGG